MKKYEQEKKSKEFELQKVKIHDAASKNWGWTKMANFQEELARSSEAGKDHKGEEGRK